MNNDVTEILDRKLADPETRQAVESLLDNIGTISRSVKWVRTLEETGMGEFLQGLTYLVANLRTVLTDDMLNGVSSILNSLLEVLSKISDPQVVDGVIALLDGISSGRLSKEPKVHGTFSLLSELKDPEVEAGLAVTINILKGLGKVGSK
ncbi:MAG: DUF1641 domain-containing protein [Candidatus Thermoplasmatota archaeon]|nr:DUF1641 domain-containing protein [Candidatus Thermoplasmatota archaeon]